MFPLIDYQSRLKHFFIEISCNKNILLVKWLIKFTAIKIN